MAFRETHTWAADKYARSGRFVADLAGPVMELAAVEAGQHILDLGCGDGVLTEAMANMGANVVGVDASPEMIKAASLRGLDARVIDGQKLTFSADFDLVFSNAALHWMPDADAVIRGVYKALKPGGRFVAEFGGMGNIATIRTAARAAHKIVTGKDMPDDKKYFPSDDVYKMKLEDLGFNVLVIGLHPRRTLLPGSLRDWYDTFGGRYVHGLEGGEASDVFDLACALAEPELKDEQGRWWADYVRLRFHAVKTDRV